ncbi:hypothetical protein C1646_760645 [Rhizophagus diaphanus]|nr:hypothetical protein C1646_760645 [Rhizophagus diaphanus] [Rhizophagus sp. MUCL 43196]
MFNYKRYWIREKDQSSSEENEDRKEFTKRLLHMLADYMSDNKTYIQTFLSGIALQDVVKLKELTGYNFNYINCPLLSIGTCIEIVNNFAVKENDTNYHDLIKRTDKVLESDKKLPIYGILERDKHLILKDVDGKLFIAMPVYFIYFLYNKTLNLTDVVLSEAFISNQCRIEWQNWETFIAYFEIFKVNLLASGKTTAKLNKIYPVDMEEDFQILLKLADVKGEHSKNLATLKNFAIPDNIIVVCKDNFHQHFGIFGTEIEDIPESLMLKQPISLT